MTRRDEKQTETIDGATGMPDATPQTIKLSGLRDVRLEMARVYRKVNSGEIESHDGSRRVFMLRQIADVIVATELERRVEELESRAALPSAGRPALRAVN